MELKGRLKLIADLIPEGSILCDIGTDHAFIPIYAVAKGICSKVVAADIRTGPVRAATRNVTKHKMKDKIDVRLGGGLQPIMENELGTVIIAGMGGLLITEIFQESFEKAKNADYIILQPMNAVEVVRSYLYEKGFEIVAERLAVEESKIYNVICTKWTGNIKKADEFDCYIGNILLQGGDENLQLYLDKKLGQLNTAISGMEQAKEEPDNLEEYKGIRDKLSRIMRHAGKSNETVGKKIGNENRGRLV